mmetsp:Transcript_30687/g.63572  ORF Transcript_30687/g.63572 Transcript_30687/m.63572 type:complete len:86 (+) Transcript_30687:1063-1320(+)
MEGRREDGRGTSLGSNKGLKAVTWEVERARAAPAAVAIRIRWLLLAVIGILIFALGMLWLWDHRTVAKAGNPACLDWRCCCLLVL